jgi:transcriptional regulator with XRE-family HTH domain
MTEFGSTEARNAWIAQERRKGRTLREIAEDLGMSRAYVAILERRAREAGRLRPAGIPPPDPGRATWESVFNRLGQDYYAGYPEIWEALHQERPLAILGAGILEGFGPEEVAREIARELGWRSREEGA